MPLVALVPGAPSVTFQPPKVATLEHVKVNLKKEQMMEDHAISRNPNATSEKKNRKNTRKPTTREFVCGDHVFYLLLVVRMVMHDRNKDDYIFPY